MSDSFAKAARIDLMTGRVEKRKQPLAQSQRKVGLVRAADFDPDRAAGPL